MRIKDWDLWDDCWGRGGVRGESIIVKSSQLTKNGYLGLIVIVCRTDCGNSCVYRTCR